MGIGILDIAYQKYSEALDNETNGGDPEHTLNCLYEAFELGSVEAAYALGSFYLHGKHVKRNPEKAMEYLSIAANSMYVEALKDIALGSERGDLLPKNEKRAFKNYFLAMLAGDTDAMYEVGRCYCYGIGTERNQPLKTALTPDSPF